MNPRGDGPFQILEKINDNAYKVDLPGEYRVSSTFNVSDLSLFDADSRTNPFEERGNDENQGAQPMTQDIQDPLEVPEGPITRSRAKKIKDAMNGLVQKTLTNSRHGCSSDSTLKIGLHDQGPPLLNLIQALKDSI